MRMCFYLRQAGVKGWYGDQFGTADFPPEIFFGGKKFGQIGRSFATLLEKWGSKRLLTSIIPTRFLQSMRRYQVFENEGERLFDISHLESITRDEYVPRTFPVAEAQTLLGSGVSKSYTTSKLHPRW